MSALGEYVHLNKINYFKYGISYKTLRSQGGYSPLIQQWSNLHNQIAAEISSEVNIGQEFEVEKALNNQMINLKNYMEMLANTPEDDENKQRIYDELFTGALAEARDLVSIDLATGKVSAKIGKQSSSEDQIDFIKRWDNVSGYVKISDVLGKEQINNEKIDVSAIIQQTLNLSKDFLKSIKATMTSADINKLKNNYIAIENYLKKSQAYINRVVRNQKQFSSILDFGQIKSQVNNFNRFKNKYQGTKWIKIEDDLARAAMFLVKARSLMKIPDVALIQGKLEEILLRDFLKTLDTIGVTTVSDKIGNIVNSGNGSKYISKYVAPYVETFSDASSSLQIKQVNNKEDKITKMLLNYHYNSQKKADVNFQWAVQGNNSDKIDYGISVKNYMAHNIGLVSKSPLIAFIFNNPYFNEDKINHLLNAITEQNNTKEDHNLESSINRLKTEANLALRLSILWSAMTGQNVGKDSSNNAQFIVLNVPYLDTPMVVSTKRLIKTILSNQNLNDLVSVRDDYGRDLQDGSFTLQNKKVTANSNSKKALFVAAHERIGTIINELHARKMTVTIPQKAITTASNTLNYIS